MATEAAKETRQDTQAVRPEAEVPVSLGANGPAMAAILAAAIGVFALGLATTLAAAGEGAKDWLNFQNRVGPLSGKTTMAGVVWLVSWAVLHFVWWRRDVSFAAVVALAIVLIVVGNVLMFPPVFERFEP